MNHIYLIYMYKDNLVMDYLKWLICDKTQLNIYYAWFILAQGQQKGEPS